MVVLELLMHKRVLITAGPVYGRLDDNKLVGNRSRGIWAVKFAQYLESQGHEVLLLVSDLQEREVWERLVHKDISESKIQVVVHDGFESYMQQCMALASQVDAMVLAAAVVNWIPEQPFPGKMPTKGFQPGNTLDIRFILAERVIDRMKRINPKLTLIGCKMASGETHDHLIEAAYETLLGARCNAVVANDLKELKDKYVVHQDRTVLHFDVKTDPSGFQRCLVDLIEDVHYTTVQQGLTDFPEWGSVMQEAAGLFDGIAVRYRERFVKRLAGSDKVFGSLAVRAASGDYLVSPREKGEAFSSSEAVVVRKVSTITHEVTCWAGKATLNAPLLIRHLELFPKVSAVLHLHEQLPRAPMVSYAPPGTVRDSEREIVGPAYNIAGHGFIVCVDSEGQILDRCTMSGEL